MTEEQIAKLNARLEELNKGIEETKSLGSHFLDCVDRIEKALLGDKDYGHKGLVDRVGETEKAVVTLQEEKVCLEDFVKVKEKVDDQGRKLFAWGTAITVVWAGLIVLRDKIFGK